MVEEFILEPSENPPSPSCRASSPSSHGSDQAVSFRKSPDPAGPSIMAPRSEWTTGPSPGEGPAGSLQAAVREPRVGARADRPRRKPRRRSSRESATGRPCLPGPNSGVGQPKPVRRVGVELPADQVSGASDISPLYELGTWRALPRIGDRQALLAHQCPDDLLGHYFGVVARTQRA